MSRQAAIRLLQTSSFSLTLCQSLRPSEATGSRRAIHDSSDSLICCSCCKHVSTKTQTVRLEGENCIGVGCDVSSGHGFAATRTPLGLQECPWWGTSWDKNHTTSCRPLRVALNHCSHPVHRIQWDMSHREPVGKKQTNSRQSTRHQEPGRLAQMRGMVRDTKTVLSYFASLV